MLQAKLIKPEKIVIQEVKKPVAEDDEVLIKVKRIGICGSDIHAYFGKHPYISCPIVQGHEFSGEIVEIGKNVKMFSPGDKVTVMPQIVCGKCYPCTHGNYHICNNLKVIGCQTDGAAQEYFAVDNKLVIKLPEGMNYDQGAMVEPAAVGVHAAGRLDDVKKKKIIVMGAGPIGNLTAQVAKGLGAEAVMITDINDHRLEIAKKCDIDFTVNTATEDLGEAIQRHFGKNQADAIIECVGIEETISQAVHYSRKGTDIIVVGVFSDKPQVDIGSVQDKELRLIGTLMYKEKDYFTAIDLIRFHKINLKPLISCYFSFQDYGRAYKFIEKKKGNSMKILIDLEDGPR